jgi:hemerythrin
MTATAPALVVWKDSYSVGIPKIDAQHKTLIDLTNQLHAAMKSGKAQQAMAKTLDDLVAYTDTHFAYEESLLISRRYSGLAAHQQQHRALVGQVRELSERFRAGRLTLSIETLQFLKTWLTSHILSSDQAYAREFGG